MREILFRAKHEVGGHWVYGDLLTKPIHHECAILEHGVINNSVDPSTVGQFTGLLDNTGKKIFEGDIVRIGETILNVVFQKGAFYTPKNGSNYRLVGWDTDKIEIISNIHDSLTTPTL